jgi:hypothetical protein
MPELRAEFLLQLAADLDEPQTLAGTQHGTRRIMYFKGGAFSGPELNGRILPGGGDWVLLRSDGVAELDIRLTLRTDLDELIYAAGAGIFDISQQARQRILDGRDVDPASYYFRTTLAFETGAERYRWLNRLVAVGVGRRTRTGMATDVFAIR